MWLGFAVPVVLHTFNGLHSYFPSVPTFTFRHYNAMQNLPNAPWNAMHGLDITFYPLLVGFTYLLTLEVSFSVWFFFLVRKLEPVLGSALGWSESMSVTHQVFPFTDQQATGAFLALATMILWSGRKRLAGVLLQAWNGVPAAPGGMSCRAALLGVLGGLAALVAFVSMAGLNPWAALAFFAIFFLFSFVLTRIRAEAGLGGITGPMTPQETMLTATGTAPIGAQGLTILAYLNWMSIDLRGLATLMPAQMEDFKMADTWRLSVRSMVVAAMFATAFSAVLAYVIYLPIIYYHGGVTMNGQRFTDYPVVPFRMLASQIASPKPADATALGALMFGFLVTVGLSALRLRFVWWPFHPIGYAVGFSRRSIEWMWFSTFLGWLCKAVILRYSGMQGFRRALPFFLGFILGEFSMGIVFAILGCVWPETAGYQLYP